MCVCASVSVCVWVSTRIVYGHLCGVSMPWHDELVMIMICMARLIKLYSQRKSTKTGAYPAWDVVTINSQISFHKKMHVDIYSVTVHLFWVRLCSTCAYTNRYICVLRCVFNYVFMCALACDNI